MITNTVEIQKYWKMLRKCTNKWTRASTAPGTPRTHPWQYLVSRGWNILYPTKFVIVVVIIVRLNLTTVYIIWRNVWRKMHQNAQICKLKFKIFPGLCPERPCWEACASLRASIVRKCLFSRWCHCKWEFRKISETFAESWQFNGKLRTECYALGGPTG